MEYYVLFICKGISAVEKQHIINYIRNYLPDNDEFSTGSNSSTSLYHSLYLNVVKFFDKLEKDVKWKEVKSESDIRELLSTGDEDITNKTINCESSLVSDLINNLADQLPFCGSFKLDVVLNCHIVYNLNVSDNIEFAASLHRLSKWHAARTYFYFDDKLDCPEFKEWLELTNAEMINIDQLNSDFVLWRGSIEFKHPNIWKQCYENFELSLDSGNKNSYFNLLSSALENYQSTAENLVLHPVVQAMDVCNFSSIPLHMFIPTHLKLHVTSSNSNNSIKLLDCICKKSKVALILRMGYSVTNKKPKPDKSLCTKKWHKIIVSNNAKFPESCLPYVDKYVPIAVTKSPHSESAIAYIFRKSSSFDAQFYFNAVNLQYQKRVEKTSFACDIPFLPDIEFRSHLMKFEHLDTESKNSGFTDESSSEKSNLLLSSVMASIASSEHSLLHLGENLGDVKYEEVDPIDWPERVFLLQKQIQIEDEMKNKRNTFFALSPQRAQYNVSFSCDDIKKYFQLSGEAKDDSKAEPIQSLKAKANHSNEILSELLKKEWPEVLKYTYSDVYYNVNSLSEEQEDVGNKMVRCFVQHETASTCNPQQSLPDAPISMQARYLTPRKRSKTPKSETSLRQDMMNARDIFSNEGMKSNPVISNIMKTLGVNTSSNDAAITEKRLPRKNSFPVRCSPRKKTSVKYYPPPSRQSIEMKKHTLLNSAVKEKSPNELPELMKKKLRVAVASALETNEIDMKNILFRSCFKKLFAICQAFVQDIPRKGSTSQYMKKIADAHVKQEKNKLLRILNVLQNIVDQMYLPVEHIAWAADKKILKTQSSSFHNVTSILWALSTYFSILRSLVTLSRLESTKEYAENVLKRNVAKEQLQELIFAFKSSADFIIAVNYLPSKSLLWAGTLSPKRIALLGLISSVLRILLVLRNKS